MSSKALERHDDTNNKKKINNTPCDHSSKERFPPIIYIYKGECHEYRALWPEIMARPWPVPCTTSATLIEIQPAARATGGLVSSLFASQFRGERYLVLLPRAAVPNVRFIIPVRLPSYDKDTGGSPLQNYLRIDYVLREEYSLLHVSIVAVVVDEYNR